MKLDELNLDGYKHIKNNNWELPENLINWLEEKNFSLVGKGAYSSVYESTTEKFVIKLNRGKIDEGYLEFVEFCQNNKGNPHLPKMGKIKKYENWYIIFIEKLEPMENKNYDETTAYNIAYNIGEISIGRKMVDLSSYTEDVKKQIIECGNILKKFVSNAVVIKFVDMDSKNIMLRGNTIVVTDPVI